MDQLQPLSLLLYIFTVKARLNRSPVNRNEPRGSSFHLGTSTRMHDSTMKQWTATQDRCSNMKGLKAQIYSPANLPEQGVERPENVIVGHETEFEMMLDQLVRGERSLEVTSIVGMWGIQKTTLATNLYIDPRIISQFDSHANFTVSHEYCVRNVLLGLLSSASEELDDVLAD